MNERLMERLRVGCPELCADCDYGESELDCTLLQKAADAIEQLQKELEMARADREGQCVALPCKVGDTVYGNDGEKVTEYKVFVISLATYNWYLRCQNSNSDFWITDAEIGETVFLTREEAEAALEAQKGE